MRTPLSDFTSYEDDVSFMRSFIDLVELREADGEGMVAVSAALQGRVMTSSASGPDGRSNGWINRALFSSGDTLEHINAYGGEERFWLGPEGGQYSIFFKSGDPFDLDHWQTPRLIDLSPYEISGITSSSASFTKQAILRNYADFEFELSIKRTIEVLSAKEIATELQVAFSEGIRVVAYRTTNSLSNIGDKDWRKETGLLSIWLLGMYNASSSTTVVIPFIAGSEAVLGKPVTDDYFGKVPANRLVVKDEVLYFSADANHRSKIGLTPRRAKNILGSYDAENRVLTVVKYKKPEGEIDYVNSLWEIQEEPYAGDVINAYNDGPPSPGELQLGKFYELETSSPA
ncbi:MAG: hypothetical protein KTR24_07260, partial [Saprospiraceae bacterium]|nr:hypothetical protein [Saprospiraceae bacterium]